MGKISLEVNGRKVEKETPDICYCYVDLTTKNPTLSLKLILLDIIKFFPQRVRQCHKLPYSHLDR